MIISGPHVDHNFVINLPIYFVVRKLDLNILITNTSYDALVENSRHAGRFTCSKLYVLFVVNHAVAVIAKQ